MTTTTTTLSCKFPGCEMKDLKPETALVPAIKAIQQAEGGRPVTPAILANHVLCNEHGALGRGIAGGMFSYTETVNQLERRMAERAQAKTFFAKYAEPPRKAEPPKPVPAKPIARPQSLATPRPPASKTAMQIAFEKGGVTSALKPNGIAAEPKAATA
jgi:hypothetical protein